jgi:hypothetical protein
MEGHAAVAQAVAAGVVGLPDGCGVPRLVWNLRSKPLELIWQIMNSPPGRIVRKSFRSMLKIEVVAGKPLFTGVGEYPELIALFRGPLVGE